MKSTDLKYFVGKPCTIFTPPINRNFKEENPQTYPEPIFIYFIGVVESVTDQGLFLQQVANTGSKKPLKTYFFLDKILGIAEEESLSYEDPHDAEIIKKIKEKTEEEELKIAAKAEQVKQIVSQQNPYMDPDALAEMAHHLKQNYADRK